MDDTQKMRKKIKQYVDTADETVLKMMHAVLKAGAEHEKGTNHTGMNGDPGQESQHGAATKKLKRRHT